jgi:hypothetical protein
MPANNFHAIITLDFLVKLYFYHFVLFPNNKRIESKNLWQQQAAESIYSIGLSILAHL